MGVVEQLLRKASKEEEEAETGIGAGASDVSEVAKKLRREEEKHRKKAAEAAGQVEALEAHAAAKKPMETINMTDKAEDITRRSQASNSDAIAKCEQVEEALVAGALKDKKKKCVEMKDRHPLAEA